MTRKQRNILQHLAEAQSRGETVTMDDLVGTLGVGSTKQAMQCTLRFLERKLLLERRYDLILGKHRCVLELTSQGFLLGSALPP